MNVKSSTRVFRFVFFFGCGSIVRLLDCLTISAVYGESDVEFTCVISPYMNIQQWKIGSGVVAGCGAVSCSEEASNPARYSFTPNRTSGIFIFKIDSINSTDDKTIVGCFDGIDTKTLAIDFSVNNNPSESDEPANNKLFSLLVLLVVIPVTIILIMICVPPKFTNIELTDTKIHLKWTDRLNCCRCCQRNSEYHIVCNPIKGEMTDTKRSTKEKYYTLENLNPMAMHEISLSRKYCCSTKRCVITRTAGMPNDQGYQAMPTSIRVWWTKPECITNPRLKYQVTCNEVVKLNTLYLYTSKLVLFSTMKSVARYSYVQSEQFILPKNLFTLFYTRTYNVCQNNKTTNYAHNPASLFIQMNNTLKSSLSGTLSL